MTLVFLLKTKASIKDATSNQQLLLLSTCCSELKWQLAISYRACAPTVTDDKLELDANASTPQNRG